MWRNCGGYHLLLVCSEEIQTPKFVKSIQLFQRRMNGLLVKFILVIVLLQNRKCIFCCHPFLIVIVIIIVHLILTKDE